MFRVAGGSGKFRRHKRNLDARDAKLHRRQIFGGAPVDSFGLPGLGRKFPGNGAPIYFTPSGKKGRGADEKIIIISRR